MAKKKTSSKKVESIRHKDKRKNIPTEELRGFASDDERAPKKMLYPRDPSLDPQLVWKGKDEQDREDLAVPVVPIYIQEKIHPQAIIDALPHIEKAGDSQFNLFADFNGGPTDFAQKVEFYQHEHNWSNRMILGDSLLVMTSLAEKEGLKGKVQTIYFDPPYGIKFGSNWQVSTRKRDVKDGRAEDVTRQPEQIRAFRDTWKLGIHSYLAYLRDRLVVARELLTESGSVFVQIGDENVHLVRCVMDEVFGSENFIAIVSFAKTSGLEASLLNRTSDYLIWYSKVKELVKYRQLYLGRELGGEGASGYTQVLLADGTVRPLSKSEKADDKLPEGARVFAKSDLTSQGNPVAEYKLGNNTYRGGWKTNPPGMRKLELANRIYATEKTLNYIRFYDDFPMFPLSDSWTDTLGQNQFGGKKIYVVQTQLKTVERCILMTTDPGDLVLDPTCGSGTTAYVAEQWGRRWITIDTSRVALALARTRLMAAKYPYYHLADDHPEAAQMNTDEEIKKYLRKSAESAESADRTSSDIKKGFVYRRVPHITLKSIANNEEIDGIHSKWQQQLEPLRKQLNGALGQSWEEWQVPLKAHDDWPDNAKQLHAQWLRLRRQRQQELDAAIARHADTETLFDQPYIDNKRVRVSGPFTVESLSPHRTMSVEEKKELAERGRDAWRIKPYGLGDFAMTILENLKKAGVQNTFKGERLKFDTLEPYPGQYINGEGTYTEANGRTSRVAVCIGPELGTVGPLLIKEAAKEAVQGMGFDVLIVCGFAFDPHVPEDAKRYGKLTVLPTKMNIDLAQHDKRLKNTGAGNLFMVFGEPDIEMRRLDDGRIVIEIKGLDVYDPTTGQIRSASTDDIACWFIDTNYNDESFFVRHAYFTGAQEPYKKLKRALRAEIDEEAWSSLYSTESRPFDPPETGKIAIKVINHYGDEVLKVYEVNG